jgi:hypothetical protein
VLAQGLAAQRDDQKRRTPELQEQVPGHEQPCAAIERIADAD